MGWALIKFVNQENIVYVRKGLKEKNVPVNLNFFNHMKLTITNMETNQYDGSDAILIKTMLHIIYLIVT